MDVSNWLLVGNIWTDLTNSFPILECIQESKVITIRDNITQIKYIKVVDKLYHVTDISFADMTIRAVEIKTAASVSQNEVFCLDELKEFKIRLINNGGMADIVDFGTWKKNKRNI